MRRPDRRWGGEDDLASARGILVGVLASMGLWAVLFAAIWIFSR